MSLYTYLAMTTHTIHSNSLFHTIQQHITRSTQKNTFHHPTPYQQQTTPQGNLPHNQHNTTPHQNISTPVQHSTPRHQHHNTTPYLLTPFQYLYCHVHHS